MGSNDREATVLVVDDENAVADAYTAQLQSEYETQTAYGGEEALETVDGDVDVVLLDRRMPDISGDEVLDRIRERELSCRVIMVTAVDPDFDIVDMPFEDYLQKPAGRDELIEAIEKQLLAGQYDKQFTEYMELSTKVGLLEEEKSRQELENTEEVQEIKQRAEELKTELDETVDEFEDPQVAFQDLL
jgi:DNA-binding response OmpR family regulator